MEKTYTNTALPESVEKALGITPTVKYAAIEDEDNFIDDEICVLNLHSLKPQEGKLPSEKAFNETFEQVSFKGASEDEKEMCKRLYEDNKMFFIDFFNDLFWLVQMKMFHSDSTADVTKYNSIVGKKWTNFIFPLEVSDGNNMYFLNSFPYFATQAIQNMYMNITHGNVETKDKKFRMQLCSILVNIFTSLTPLESQISKNLTEFFSSPPEYRDSDEIERKSDTQEDNPLGKEQLQDAEDIITDVKLPVEDLKTLTKMQRRRRPISKKLNMTGVSSLVSAATNHRSVPFEHDAQIVIQYPAGGESDWLENLPPLLPPPRQPLPTGPDDRARRTKEYNPMSEPRSYLHRSLRPNICDSIKEMKEQFQRDEESREAHLDKLRADLSNIRKRLEEEDKPTKDKFIKDLRALQAARKRNETPELPEEKSKPTNGMGMKNEVQEETTKAETAVKGMTKEENAQLLDRMRAAHDDANPMFESLMQPPYKHRSTEPHASEVLVAGVIRPLLEERRKKEEADRQLKIEQAEQRALDSGIISFELKKANRISKKSSIFLNSSTGN